MKSKKLYIILMAVILVFFIVMFLLFGLGELKKEGYDTTIIVEDDTVWVYNNKRWGNITSYDKFNWEKYDVYLDNNKKGNYSLWYNDKWYAFDSKKKAVALEGSLLAIKSNVDISVYSFESNEIDDYSYVYSVLEDNKLPKDSKFTVNKKVLIDYDNDGEEEEFYLISNAFSLNFKPEKVFSIVFMVKDEEIYPIYTNINNYSGYNGCRPYFSSFLDIDDNSKSEFILSCGKYSISGVDRMLYEFKDNEFKILISNNK